MASGAAAAAPEAYAQGSRGDFRPALGLLAALDAERSRVADAWALALRAQLWLADPGRGALPEAGTLASFRDAAEARAGAALACVHAERAAWLAFDAAEHARLVEVHRTLAGDADGWVALGRGELALAEGRESDALAHASEAQAWGSQVQDAALVLEATGLRAFATAVAGDREEATRLARRASRMARTEALPQPEYAVNLVLARVRRVNGAPHLGSRILHALLRVAPAPWRAWLDWELLLAEGLRAPASPAAKPARGRASAGVRAAAGLRALIQAAADADRTAYERARAATEAAVESIAPLAHDLRVLRRLTDPEGDAGGDDAVGAFLRGETSAVPEGLHGTCDIGSGEAAHVLARPGRQARRVLAPALPLACVAAAAEALPAAPGRQARTESTLAALALAGEDGLAEDALFRAVYGFEFKPAVHAGVRDVLYTRVRQRLGARGVLERAAGTVRLRLAGPILLPDPRCSPPPESEVLRVLARLRRASPAEAAEALGMPVRTVRDILERLVEEGALRLERMGRQVEYHLEDTTFAEPTTQVAPPDPR